MSLCCPPPTPSELLPDRDILDEVVPTTVTYIVPQAEGDPIWLDYRERMLGELRAMYEDRPICYDRPDHWVKVVKPFFSPERLNLIGKQVGIYKQDSEVDMTYQRYKITDAGGVRAVTTSQSEDMPDVDVSGGEEYLSQRGKTNQESDSDRVTEMIQEVGPGRGPDYVKQLITAMYNPLLEFCKGLDKYFIPFEWMCEWQ